MPDTKTSTTSSSGAPARKTSNKKVWTILGLTVGGLGALAGAWFFLVKPAMDKKKAARSLPDDRNRPPALPPTTTTTTTTTTRPPRNTGASSSWKPDNVFPLKRGMRGERVRTLQRGLNRQFSTSLATDGMWGSKTQAALDRNNVATPISSAAWRVMLQHMGVSDPYQMGGSSGQAAGGGGGQASVGSSPSDLAQGLAVAKAQRDFSGTKVILGRMHTARDYKAVRDAYKARYGRTVIDATLGRTAPWSPAQRAEIRNEFLRMGLIYDRFRDMWSMPSGLGSLHAMDSAGLHAVTIRDTPAWDVSENRVSLPAGVVLGMVVERGPNMTTILTPAGDHLFVSSTAIAVA